MYTKSEAPKVTVGNVNWVMERVRARRIQFGDGDSGLDRPRISERGGELNVGAVDELLKIFQSDNVMVNIAANLKEPVESM
ncbi:hypothetical protein C1H46_010768 [Malus baccata]|uniref:Uncharacterized protein n=1 Tax=Malus baccata TaxID=106549 RepID=A0A540MXX5_MALBA|nr:hypothetical protein C1H46_010768 [Malus baccata]